MITKSRTFGLLIGLLLGVAGAISARAASTIVTFSVDMATNIASGSFTPGTSTLSANGTYNGWGTGLTLVQKGSSTVYTNTVNDTTDANGGVLEYKFVINGSDYESPASSQNRCARLPAASGASLVLPTPFFSDDGAPVTNYITFQVDVSQQIALGTFTPGTSYVEVQGSFNNWTTGADVTTNDTSIIVTNQYGLVTTNVWVGTFPVVGSPAAMADFKYVIEPGKDYESPSPVNLDGNNNRYLANVAGTLPIVNFSDEAYAPLSQVTFSVDMSAQLYYGNWTPSDGVFCAGINGDWNNDTVNTMTNNSSASNTNIYYATYTLGEGSSSSYKFTYNGSSGTVYESPASTGGNNRSYTVPLVTNALVPTVYFSDLSIDDLLTTNILVTFSVDMSNAVEYGTSYTFNPSVDTVYVNGAWLGWTGWNPIDLAPYELTNTAPNNPNNYIYSGQFLVPMGNSIPMTYKYSMDGSDDEAASGNNHVRYIRTAATGSYNFPTDTFGNQYNEPSFGELAVGSKTGGQVQLSWLGTPNVQVQTSSTLASNSWVSLPQTSGAVWSAGTNSINGLVSVTNWPAGSGSTFFRLIKK